MRLRILAGLLRGDGRHTIASILVSCAASALLTINMTGIVTTSSASGQAGAVLRSFSTPSAVLTCVCAIFALTSVFRLAVESNRGRYWSWRIAGMVPTRIFSLILAQCIVLTAAGGTLGAVIGLALSQPVFDLVFSATSAYGPPALQLGPTGPVIAVCVVTVITVLTTAQRAWVVARSAPRADGHRAGRPSRRFLGSSVAFVGAISAFCLLGNTSAGSLMSTVEILVPVAILSACATAVFIGVSATTVLPHVITAWTSLVPAGVSPAWFLARHRARAMSERSVALVAPGIIASTLCGALFSTFLTIEHAFVRMDLLAPGATTINMPAISALLAAPVALACVSIACSMYLTTGHRIEEYVALIDAGARPSLILRTTFLEATIYTATVLIVAASAVFLVAACTASSLGRWAPGATPALAWMALMVPAVLFFVVQTSIAAPAATRALVTVVRR